MLTVPQLKSLVQNSIVYDASALNADGTPRRFKVSSVKTWKTRPDDFEVCLKYGLGRGSNGFYLHLKKYDMEKLCALCLSELEAIEQRAFVERELQNPDNIYHHFECFFEGCFGFPLEESQSLITEITEMQMDINDVESVGARVDKTANRFWVCINGINLLRVKGIEHFKFIDERMDVDNRIKKLVKKPAKKKVAAKKKPAKKTTKKKTDK